MSIRSDAPGSSPVLTRSGFPSLGIEKIILRGEWCDRQNELRYQTIIDCWIIASDCCILACIDGSIGSREVARRVATYN